MKKYISDIITDEEINSWKAIQGNILLKSNTGTGKTTFIKNKLKDKKILYVCNRKGLFEQFNKDCLDNKLDNIDIHTYQEIENKLINEKIDLVDYMQYDYIILDEIHYYTNDIYFNYNLYKSYDFLFNILKNKQKILISATSKEIELLSNINIKKTYDIDSNNSYINLYELNIQDMYSHIAYIYNNMLKNDRAIIFCQKINQYKKILKELKDNYRTDIKKDTIFFSSDIISKHCNNSIEDDNDYNKEYKNITEKCNFDVKILSCTKVFDNGISLNYENATGSKIKYIFILESDINTVIQEIGRIRIKNTDTENIHCYILKHTRKKLQDQITKLEKKLNMYNDYIHHKKKFIKENPLKSINEPFFILDDDLKIKINELTKEVINNRVKLYQEIDTDDYTYYLSKYLQEYYNIELKEIDTNSFELDKKSYNIHKMHIYANEFEISDIQKAELYNYLNGKDSLCTGGKGSYRTMRNIIGYEQKIKTKNIDSVNVINYIFEKNNIEFKLKREGSKIIVNRSL